MGRALVRTRNPKMARRLALHSADNETEKPVSYRLMAERMRFELTVRFNPHNRFPGDRLQPLGHLSALKNFFFRSSLVVKACLFVQPTLDGSFSVPARSAVPATTRSVRPPFSAFAKASARQAALKNFFYPVAPEGPTKCQESYLAFLEHESNTFLSTPALFSFVLRSHRDKSPISRIVTSPIPLVVQVLASRVPK